MNITKKYLIALGLLLILAGTVFVYAYNPNWQTTSGTPSIFGHSPDESLVRWSNIFDIPPGFSDGVDNIGVSVDCPVEQLKVGSVCKVLTACTANQALSYNGNIFSCVNI